MGIFLLQVIKGFCNWRKATEAFRKHRDSKSHREAVEVMLTLLATTQDVGEQLVRQLTAKKTPNHKMILKIISCVHYLAQQELALRGDGDERNSNFLSLLSLCVEDDAALGEWLTRKDENYMYTCHQVQNEITKIMASEVLQGVSSSLHKSPFLTVMIDETTDVSNRE